MGQRCAHACVMSLPRGGLTVLTLCSVACLCLRLRPQLSDTNITDHTTHMFKKEGLSFLIEKP